MIFQNDFNYMIKILGILSFFTDSRFRLFIELKEFVEIKQIGEALILSFAFCHHFQSEFEDIDSRVYSYFPVL